MPNKSTTPIQATGSYDVLTKEYSFSICSGELAVTFEFLKKEDIEHFVSCLTCMLYQDEDWIEQWHQAALGYTRGGEDDHVLRQGVISWEPGEYRNSSEIACLLY